ncbi:uncharacterized protein LOC127081728 [Lathyrus oleraceus]|uniref:uncharacterized protein LOC127081728 n=1 Tax=Pisum sativum TaxID=3888 RepID=UPI0021D16AA7|nr:uncharacterized protein LOC127081728 [Pisum sativum]
MCNGLFLFCCKDGRADNIVPGVYHYFVLNPVTKQCVAVLKPVGQKSGGYSYAALAYDHEESWFFKIIRFQGHRHINIFSSKTGIWTTLTICFPEYINESYWVKKCVYLKGSIYRLSYSGHLLRIKVDPQENVSKQAEVIKLHPDCLFDDSQWKISLKDNKILLVLSRGMNFMCFELVECVTKGVCTYTWHINHNKENEKLLFLNTNGELLAFYPFNDTAVFKIRSLLYFYFYNLNGNNIKEIVVFRPNKIALEYIRKCGQPLLKCFVPFACCLEKEVSSNQAPEIADSPVSPPTIDTYESVPPPTDDVADPVTSPERGPQKFINHGRKITNFPQSNKDWFQAVLSLSDLKDLCMTS